MVCKRAYALPDQPCRYFLDFPAREAIDDTGVAVMLSTDKIKQLCPAIHFVHNLIANIGTVETGNEYAGAVEAEPFNDFLACHVIRRCGQGDAWHVGKALMQNRKLDVLRAEVVPPLRHAMRLINSEQREMRTREQIKE